MLQDIHDIRGPVEVGADWNPLLWGAVALLLLLLFALGAWLLKKYLTRKKDCASRDKTVSIDPFKEIISQLDHLADSGDISTRRFYIELTLLTRKYVGLRFDAPAAEMTTHQFVGCVRKVLPDETLESGLISFYKGCDLYKYAGKTANQQQMATDLETVRTLIAGVEERLKQDQEKISPNGSHMDESHMGETDTEGAL